MTGIYISKNIRDLLTEGFTSDELRNFCFDHPDFKPLYQRLPEGADRVTIVSKLVEYAHQKVLIESLLVWAKEHNSARYEKHQPYYSDQSTPAKFQAIWKKQISSKPTHLFASPDYLCAITQEAIHFLSPSDGESLLPPLTTIGELSLTDYIPTGGAVTPGGSLFLTLLPSRLTDKASLWLLQLVDRDAAQSKQISCKQFYEAPSTQLSPPVIDQGLIWLIQRGPELVALDLPQGQLQQVTPLPKLGNLPRDCISFSFAAGRLCLAMRNGAILALDLQTDQTATLRQVDESILSPLATDGLHLFFGVKSYIHTLEVISNRLVWDFKLPPDSSGRYRSVESQPLIVGDTLYVAGHHHYLHALDLNTGEERWRYEMSSGTKPGPVWTGQTVVIADRQGNIHALQISNPTFIVTCHYDLKTPPVLNEWNPIIFTLINTSDQTARNTILRLSGDFEGSTEHHTQKLYTIRPADFKRRDVRLKPTASGATVYLCVIVDYQDGGDGSTRSEQFDLYLPVRGLNSDPPIQRETGLSSDGQWRFNYVALRALLRAALSQAELTQIYFEQFFSASELLNPDMGRDDRINAVIDYAHRHQQVEHLLNMVQQRIPKRFEPYLREVKSRTEY